jgi:hypothetical protein
MTKIPTDKFKPKLGTMNAYLFENPDIGLKPTLFYDITIPLEPFKSGLNFESVLDVKSGLEYESGPVETSFCLNFIKFPVTNWLKFDGQSFKIAQDDADGSIYLGAAHNPVDIKLIRFRRLDGFKFRINCVLFCDFSFAGVADSETVDLITDIEFKGLVVGLDNGEYRQEDILKAKEIALRQGKRQVRKYLKEATRLYARERALEIASRLVDLSCYAEPESNAGRIVFRPRMSNEEKA